MPCASWQRLLAAESLSTEVFRAVAAKITHRNFRPRSREKILHHAPGERSGPARWRVVKLRIWREGSGTRPSVADRPFGLSRPGEFLSIPPSMGAADRVKGQSAQDLDASCSTRGPRLFRAPCVSSSESLHSILE